MNPVKCLDQVTKICSVVSVLHTSEVHVWVQTVLLIAHIIPGCLQIKCHNFFTDTEPAGSGCHLEGNLELLCKLHSRAGNTRYDTTLVNCTYLPRFKTLSGQRWALLLSQRAWREETIRRSKKLSVTHLFNFIFSLIYFCNREDETLPLSLFECTLN